MTKKNLLSLILAVVMIFSCAIPAIAANSENTLLIAANPFSVSLDDQYAEVGEKMKDLGIMEGYEDGELRLSNKITRAEFVTMLIRALGYDNMLGLAENKFTDVPATHWAKDYIALANALGYVNGVGENRFNPDKDITIVEVETVLLRILGYGNMADSIGWPTGYTLYAERIGLDENVDIIGNIAAARGHVAQLVDNALTIPFYGTRIADGKNILTRYLGLNIVTGENYSTALTDSSLNYNEIELNGRIYATNKENVMFSVGGEITAYLNDKKDIVYVDYAENDGFHGIVTTVSSKYLYVDNRKASYNKNTEVYIDNREGTTSDIDTNMFVNVSLNDNGYASTIYAYTFDKTNVKVTSMTERYVKFKGYTGSGSQYQINNKQSMVYRDGVVYDVETLEVGENVSIVYDSDYVWFFVTDQTEVKGKFSSLSTKGLKIGNQTYQVGEEVTYSTNNNKTVKVVSDISDLTALLGLEVRAILNMNNEVIHIYVEYTDENMAMGIVVDKFILDKQYVTILNLETTEYETYSYNRQTNKYNENPIEFSDLVVFGEDEGISFVELTHDDTVLKTISPYATQAPSKVTKIFSSSIRTENGTYYVDDNTIVVKADGEINDMSIVNWSKIKNLQVSDNVEAVIVTGDDNILAKYILITDGYEFIGDDIEYGLIYAVGSTVLGTFYEVETMDGEKTVVVQGKAPSKVGIGDVISFRTNIDDYAVDIKVLTPTVDVVTFMIDDQFIEFKNANDFYPINPGAIVLNLIEDEEDYDYDNYTNRVDIDDIEEDYLVGYILNADKEIIYIEILSDEYIEEEIEEEIPEVTPEETPTETPETPTETPETPETPENPENTGDSENVESSDNVTNQDSNENTNE